MNTFQENVLENTPVKHLFHTERSMRDRMSYGRAYVQNDDYKGTLAKALTPPPIPPDDLEALRKIYHKEYTDCGRKTTSLHRMIKFFRDTQDKPKMQSRLINFIQRKSS